MLGWGHGLLGAAKIVRMATFLRKKKVVTTPLAYRDLPGLQARDLAGVVISVLEALKRPKANLLSFTADGASTMGTRRAMGDDSGDNLAKHLRAWTGQSILVTHCSPHKLQLRVSNAYSKSVPHFASH